MIERIIKKEGANAGDGSTGGNRIEWLDLVDPTPSELAEISKAYGLHETSISDSLQPEHLPKYEDVEEVRFFIVRNHDHKCTLQADTVRELTRKVSCFVGADFLLTVHRAEQPFMHSLKERWRRKSDQGSLDSLPHVVNELLRAVAETYRKPLMNSQMRFEAIETSTFGVSEETKLGLREAYVLTRSASVYRRMLRGIIDVVAKLDDLPQVSMPFYQDLREGTESLYLQAADLVENVNRIVQLQLALTGQRTNEASQRTNEVMRVLTVFSVFFMPLNLIAGIYGMNFEHMPELKQEFAYPAVLAAMASVTLTIFIWFRRKGWLHRREK